MIYRARALALVIATVALTLTIRADATLIDAVKSGNRNAIHSLLNKHVDVTLETCEKYLRFLTSMSSVVKAEKLKILYQGLILSRMLYAIDSWYPFIGDRDRFRRARAGQTR